MWNERYGDEAYAYGTEPNDFLREQVHLLPKGRVLCLAEGEGRNAVFLARQGYEVTAVDSSVVGLEKARKLAQRHAVQIEFVQADLRDYDLGVACWSAIISIFCPMPLASRRLLHRKVQTGLQAGGIFLLEAYRPEQVLRDTGGGKDREVLQSRASLMSELPDLRFEHLLELDREVIEGLYHTGVGSVVQAIARKSLAA